jgi:hypothetical protein
MKTKLILLAVCIMFTTWMLRADETITVTATSTDISENLDLKTVATLFGQAKDLEEFESMLNNPDSAFSNLDLNADGEVDYLRVIETAEGNQHLVVVQAVLAKDIYQDVASIFVDKDEETQSITVQVVGDEYIYGANYIIEPVYIYRPAIYDWFWGPSWVCWHSPYYWGYWPHWWRPFFCVDPYIYWNHCYWHHYHHPICSYRTGHHLHHRYRPMHQAVRRNDYATRYPDRSFASRNASRNVVNARSFEQNRRTAVRQAQPSANTRTRVSGQSVATRQNATGTRQTTTMNPTYGSTNVRSAATTTRTASTATRQTATTTRAAATTTTTTRAQQATVNRTSSATTPARTTTTRTSTAVRTTTTPTSTTRATTPSVNRSSSSSSMRTSSTSSVRSTSSSSMRSSAGSSMRTSGGSSMRTSSASGSRTR